MAFSFPYEPVYDVASWEKKMNHQWQTWLREEWNAKHTKKEAMKNKKHHGDSLDALKKKYTIIMPPPNVTGSLHLGHALSSALQNLLVRFHRMKGYDVLWVPGLDHASIAVQMMVEKELAAQGLKRQDLDRETFLQHAWAWKEKHGHRIIDQMKAMGFCAQWEALCFTLDEPMSHGVYTAFHRLYEKGLIYRAQRLVHWDRILQTAVSDLEVVSKTEKGSLWTLVYEGEGDVSIAVATSRPETMFGDQGVAVHPDDERYKHLVGKKVRIPLTHQWIPIFADYRVQQEKGTGAVKITPAHDPLDYTIGLHHNLPMVTIFTPQGTLISQDPVPKKYWGLPLQEARITILEDLGHHLREEVSITHNVPYSDRSQVVIEPRLTQQWYLDVEKMAQESLEAVEGGQTTFFPESWKNTYDHWLKNIQPWCLSRQLWWGHRLPVWYGPEESIFVAPSYEEALEKAQKHYGQDVLLRQEEDVLDTWFSSALWPLTTLGWPGDEKSLHHQETGYIDEKTGQWSHPRYPTDVLVTGFDILFFWVARMMMMGLGMSEKVPFRHVVIHPLIQDEKGQKMSKTKNNVIDPMAVVEACGVDTMIFALLSSLTDKMHCPFGQKNLQEAHQFMTKFWNLFRFFTSRGSWGPQASRHFVRQEIKGQQETLEDLKALQPSFNHPLHHWLLQEFEQTTKKLEELLANYAFHEALLVLKNFTWTTCCDWFVEWGKIFFQEEVAHMFTWCAGHLLRLWHPFLPFITEKLWQELWSEEGGEGGRGERVESVPGSAKNLSPKDLGTLWQASWPSWTIFSSYCPLRAQSMSWLQAMTSWTRSLRLDFSLGKTLLPVYITSCSQDLKESLAYCQEDLKNKGLLDLHLEAYTGSEKGISSFLDGVALFVPLGSFLDLDKENQRLLKAKAKYTEDIMALQKKLSNEEFLSKAPESIRFGLEERLDKQQKALAYVEECREHLGLKDEK